MCTLKPEQFSVSSIWLQYFQTTMTSKCSSSLEAISKCQTRKSPPPYLGNFYDVWNMQVGLDRRKPTADEIGFVCFLPVHLSCVLFGVHSHCPDTQLGAGPEDPDCNLPWNEQGHQKMGTMNPGEPFLGCAMGPPLKPSGCFTYYLPTSLFPSTWRLPCLLRARRAILAGFYSSLVDQNTLFYLFSVFIIIVCVDFICMYFVVFKVVNCMSRRLIHF